MGRRRETIKEIAEITNTTDRMHSKHGASIDKVSAPTVRSAYQMLFGETADWEKNRQDLLIEICDKINHEERKQLHGDSTPLSVAGLKALRDSLQQL